VYMDNSIKQLKLSFLCLTIYRNLLEDEIIKKLYSLVEYISQDNYNLYTAINIYNDFYFHLISRNENADLKEIIINNIIHDDNAFSKASELNTFQAINDFIIKSAKNDLNCLQFICEFSPSLLKSYLSKNSSVENFETEVIESLPEWNLYNNKNISTHVLAQNEIENIFISGNEWKNNIQLLSVFHNKNGRGIFACFKAFIWKHFENQNILTGVASPDPITLQDLVSYDLERSEVINNTLQFLKGFPANNILLYGDRGTGKSSTVKAILNEYYNQGLRLIEVSKSHLIDFPEIIADLKERKQKFIIFVDDLSFDDNEQNHNSLKAVLEGGIESKPSNVLIYATSNRRHLIKEKFSDRVGFQSGNADDEVRSADTMQEKLSLSDRFGITVVFSSPNKDKYLEIVEGLAIKRGLAFDKESLKKEALKWELWYNGRSPRTARQFIDWLEGEKGK
jgi:uncharacterized protein